MSLEQNRRAVGTFTNRIDVKHALDELNTLGFSMDQISVVAIDTYHNSQLDEADISDHVWYKPHDGTATCATITGSMLGAIGGCIVGLGLLAVPGVGPFLAVGTSGTALAATLAGAGIGAVSGGLIEAVAGNGISEDRARVYSDRLFEGEYLVLVDGTDDEVRRAESILSRTYSTKV